MARKKKAKTSSTSQSDQPLVIPIPPAAPVALLIDGENINAPSLIAQILAEAGRLGGVTIRQVYGNWSSPGLQSWKKYLAHYQLKPMGDHASQAGHNATDITLVIGAMDLLYSGVRHFCLVAGDSDYVPLVRRLRQWGCEVLVLGRSAASATLMKEASQFYSLEDLALRPVPSSAADMFALPSDPPTLAEMLTKAYQSIAQHDSTEWVSYSDLGTTVRQLYPNLYELYGKHSLSSYLKQCPGLFETRKRKKGKGDVSEARLRPSS